MIHDIGEVARILLLQTELDDNYRGIGHSK
jgi:hypothetical protein